MKILLYEHLCATLPADAAESCLVDEGWAMLSSLADDLADLPDVEVHTLLAGGRTLPSTTSHPLTGSLLDTLAREATGADGVILIAPEMDGELTNLARVVEATSTPLLSCSSTATELFSDKLRTAELLGELSIPTFLANDQVGTGRYVVKPRDGVGTLNTFLCDGPDLSRLFAEVFPDQPDDQLIVQPFWPGRTASTALVVDARGAPATLIAGAQHMSQQREGMAQRFCYRGGSMPLPPEFQDRARQLVARAFDLFPPVRGYLGVDLILGPDRDGSRDRIVEINPRLSTAYLGYRKLYPQALTRRLLGQSVPLPPISAMPTIHYTSTGVIG
ncbi:carbamoyl phosphate synthase-like protein [Planctomycetes bacterium Pan216]|uniref:Carbamoyl phosphate synthase-like protein n=1 Tax=Kolteria novifilia TaxID=2527975 RepID=A0A518BCS7_9BACT|nr:carbamoyl phosphate synthase-like protein [Planctomycetes bacterium Pan216]